MDDPPDWFDPSRDLRIPFIFVPHGAPDPVEWKAAHPGWVKFPATFVPREHPAEDAADEPASEASEHPQPGTKAAFARWPEPPNLHPADPFDPTSPTFDAVATLRHVGYLPPRLTDAVPIRSPSRIGERGRGDEWSDAADNPPGVDATPVPLLDDKGNPVVGASGEPAIRPASLGKSLADEAEAAPDDNES